jgi:molybdate transport system ATP-binding protein
MNANALATLREVTVTRGGTRLLDRVTWELLPGENWVLTGANGSGKSSFIRVVRGDLWPDQDGRSVRLYRSDSGHGGTSGRWIASPIGFRERTSLVSPELQDTYNRLDIDIPALSVVLAGFHDTLRPLTAPTVNQLDRARAMLEILEAGELGERSYLSLSRGEGRRILLARALVTAPAILFLDEPCAGLDRRSRYGLIELLDRLAGNGLQFVLATHRQIEVPHTATRFAAMERGRLIIQESGKTGSRTPGQCPPISLQNASSARRKGSEGSLIVSVENATVLYRGRTALDGVSWSVRRGEHWAVLGPNGSGKSTLLRLILGFAQPAVGGRVERNVAKEDDLREVRKKIGWVSPELQAALDVRLTAEQAVLSGLHGGDRLPAQIPDEEIARARQTLASLGLAHLARRRVAGLSYGQFRQVLLARALIAEPELLLLDEPLSGLDPDARLGWARLLSAVAGKACTIVVTAHYREDIPPVVTNVLELRKGRIARIGTFGKEA